MKKSSHLLIVLAFLTVYLVLGSTYLFIKIALEYFPPMIMGDLRFIIAGVVLFIWCFFRGESLFSSKIIKTAVVVGFLLIFVDIGIVIWVERFLPSGLVAVLFGATPIWFVILDYSHWKENFSNKEVVFGIIIGFIGVLFLFGENVLQAFSAIESKSQVINLCLVVIASLAWCVGSLYSKRKVQSNSNSVNILWQMLTGGIIFLIVSLIRNEWTGFHFSAIPVSGWLALFYLIIFGSLVAYSAYMWLLQVRPVTQVSTYAYVNPVVAVLLGILVAGEKVTFIQLLGLIIILTGVFLLNLAKYRNSLKLSKIVNS